MEKKKFRIMRKIAYKQGHLSTHLDHQKDLLIRKPVGKRRSKADIVGDILSLAVEGASKTAIVYQTNLNFTLAKKYIDGLLEDKLLRKAEGSVRYETTEKGLEFLKLLNTIKGLSNLDFSRDY